VIETHYDSEALKEMCDQIDLLEYAKQSVDFTRRGRDTYAAHCPLHVDKTPSLFITPSRNAFYCQSCHQGGNILTWLIKMEHLSFKEAAEKICQLSGKDISKMQICESLRYYKSLKRMKEDEEPKIIKRDILPEQSIEKYSDEIPQEWLDEGISADIMKKFQIRIDRSANRIVYPVRDKNFNLIGFKGRTRFQNYKSLNVQKYMNYTKIGTIDFFAGMKESHDYIKEKNEIIIFEGLKSVMKLWSWGKQFNAVSSETSVLNMEQIKIILEMGIKNVVIAYDNDVYIGEIRKKMQFLKRFVNVFAVIDSKKILSGEKMAPVDDGEKIWNELYEGRIKI
jgi:DNA primase